MYILVYPCEMVLVNKFHEAWFVSVTNVFAVSCFVLLFLVQRRRFVFVRVKMKVLGLHPTWLHRKATTFNGVGTSTTSGRLKIPMAIRLQESDMVIPGCVHSHEIPDKTHPLLLPQACQAQLGMTQRVREGAIALDDNDAQSSEVAQQVGTGLFMIRIDHLTYN